MKRRLLPVFVVCVLVVGMTVAAQADPITIAPNPSLRSGVSSGALVNRGDVFVQDSRTLSPTTNDTVTVHATLSPETVAFGGASIYLDPASTTHRVTGSGAAFGQVQTSLDAASIGSESSIWLSIAVASTHRFVFEGDFNVDRSGSAQEVHAGWSVLFQNLATNLIFELHDDAPSSTVTLTGLVTPGTYNFLVAVHGRARHNVDAAPPTATNARFSSSHAFTLDFVELVDAPVPEPTTLVLLGTGMAGLWLRRRRSACSHS